MDAETRHQLKQNELAEVLGKLRTLDDKRITYALIAIIAVLGLYAAFRLWSYSAQAAVSRSWQQLSEVRSRLGKETPDVSAVTDLRKLIDNSPDVSLKGYARLLLAGELNRTALADTVRRNDLLNDAAGQLKAVIDGASGAPALQAVAMFALASTHESQRKFDDAKALYQKLTTEAAYAGSPFKTLAEQRLTDFDKLSRSPAFVEGDPPAPPPGAPTAEQKAQADELLKQIQAQMPQATPGASTPAPSAPAAGSTEAAPPATQPSGAAPGSSDLP